MVNPNVRFGLHVLCSSNRGSIVFFLKNYFYGFVGGIYLFSSRLLTTTVVELRAMASAQKLGGMGARRGGGRESDFKFPSPLPRDYGGEGVNNTFFFFSPPLSRT